MIIRKTATYLAFEFYSHNGIPIPLIEKISELIPEVMVKLHCHSIVDDFMGNFHLEEGKVRYESFRRRMGYFALFLHDR